MEDESSEMLLGAAPGKGQWLGVLPAGAGSLSSAFGGAVPSGLLL